jgi:hypothetical protein
MSSEELEEISFVNDSQMAWKVGRDNYLIMQTCDDGWDYTLYDKDFKEVDGGQLDMPELSMEEARREILNDFDLGKKDLVVADYEEVVERAEAVEKHSVLQALNSLKADTGERPKLPTKSREEVR